MSSGGDSSEYSFEYSDESAGGECDDVDYDIENQFYAAKDLVGEDPAGAISGFRSILGLEAEREGKGKGEWGFKALKQLVKLQGAQGQFAPMMESYGLLLAHTETAVTRTVGEKGISSVLASLKESARDHADHLERVYQMTLEHLRCGASNERLWANTCLLLGHLYCETGQFNPLAKLLKELTQYCMLAPGGEQTDEQRRQAILGNAPLTDDNGACFDPRKGGHLLEVNALTIRMYTALKDTRKLKQIYERSLQIRSAIPHPRVLGVIRECGGKMHMQEREWDRARADFFEAFRHYDEAGAPRRSVQCLKYLVLANMLMESSINVFDSQEAKSYEVRREPGLWGVWGGG